MDFPSSLGRPQPSVEIQARLALLEEEVRAAPSLDGITIQDALELLRARLNQRVSRWALRNTLRMWESRHKLTVRESRVRLQSDVVVEILRARRAEEFARQVAAGEIELVGKAD